MKHTTFAIALLAGVALLPGCGDSSSPSSSPGGAATPAMSESAEAARKSASDTASAVGQAASDATTAARDAASDAAAAAKKTAADAADAVSAQTQSLMDQVKKLIEDGKGSEAMAKLKELGNLKLTPEQQTMVDDLMAQAQKALGGTADAAKKAADNFLKK